MRHKCLCCAQLRQSDDLEFSAGIMRVSVGYLIAYPIASLGGIDGEYVGVIAICLVCVELSGQQKAWDMIQDEINERIRDFAI